MQGSKAKEKLTSADCHKNPTHKPTLIFFAITMLVLPVNGQLSSVNFFLNDLLTNDPMTFTAINGQLSSVNFFLNDLLTNDPMTFPDYHPSTSSLMTY